MKATTDMQQTNASGTALPRTAAGLRSAGIANSLRQLLFVTLLMSLSMTLLTTTAWAETETVIYYDAYGYKQTVTATVLTGNESVVGGDICLSPGWYVVKNTNNDGVDVSYTNRISYDNKANYGTINIILADDAEMKVEVSGGAAIFFSVNFPLVIYGQSAGTGRLTANSNLTTISAKGGITINGGIVSSTSSNNDAIYAEDKDITINGGQVTATGGSYGHGFNTIGTITLGWLRVTDFITSSSFGKTVNIKNSKTLYDGATPYTGNDVSVASGNTTLRPYSSADFSQSGDTYTIHTTEGWNTFTFAMADNPHGYFTGKTVVLDADITVSSLMAGFSDRKFTGTFDGGGHTLTFNYTASGENAAPFAYVEDATIQNLHVNGSISTSNRHAAGIVSHAYGTTSITNCRSSVVINSSVSGEGSHGGIVVMNESGTLTIDGCVFDGKLLGSSTSGCGGFVGYNNATLNIKNSIFAPAALETGETWVSATNSATFARNDAPTLSNSYYMQPLGNAQGSQAHSIAAGPYVSLTFAGAPTEYSVSSITKYNIDGNTVNSVLKYGDTYYSGSAKAVQFTLDKPEPAPAGYSALNDYQASAGSIYINQSGTCHLYMPDTDVIINAFEIITYDITYDLAGGSLPEGRTNPTSYTVESPEITLVNPTKEGAVFAGWKYNGDVFQSAVIPHGSTGDRSYTALWLDNSGTWGGLAWHLSNGTLTITGSGTMNEANDNAGYPWYALAGHINAISIGEGITTIAPAAFGGTGSTAPYTNVTSLSLPSSLTSIGASAFAYCTGLTIDLATLPVSYENIGSGAFSKVGCIAGTLADDADNSSSIGMMSDALSANITLNRTLYRNNEWNTLCLPFNVDKTGDFAGATIMELAITGSDITGFDAASGTLSLYFKEANKIVSGKPYIVKWSTSGDPITSLTFNGVSVSSAKDEVTSPDGSVTFRGIYTPTNIYTAENTNLYLGAGNTLYYPWAASMTSYDLNAFRAYFQLNNGLTASQTSKEGSRAVRTFALNFGDGDASGIRSLAPSPSHKAEESIYTLDGKRLDGMPTKKGIYVSGGRKVVVK